MRNRRGSSNDGRVSHAPRRRPGGHSLYRFMGRDYVVKRRSVGELRTKLGAGLVIAGGAVMVGPDLIRDGQISLEGLGRTALLIGVMVLLNQRTLNRMKANSESRAYQYDKGYEDGWEARDLELASNELVHGTESRVVIDFSERRTGRRRGSSRARQLVDHV